MSRQRTRFGTRIPWRSVAVRLAFVACVALPALGAGGDQGSEPFEAISLLGDTLRAPALPDSMRSARQAQLLEAQMALEGREKDIDAWIWVGRRLGYLGRYREALAVFTEAIQRDPWDARLYRHRGHRYITIREFGLAVADLERAAELIQGREDEIEPDGLPNKHGIPTSTLHFNVWYHLGLAYYLQGDFENARRCYEQCLSVCRGSPDSMYATVHWLYMTLRRLGRMDEAEAVVAGVDGAMPVLENEEYKVLVQMYKLHGHVDSYYGPDNGALNSATIGYGVGCWHLTAGHEQRALEVFGRVLRVTDWVFFGHIAAEADVARKQ
jgi:Tfp pilus assembly protein PilF